jgi:hypothetical protein
MAMPRKMKILREEKLRIKFLSETGVKNTETAAKLGRNIRSIQRVLWSLKSLPEDALPPPPLKRSGCHKKLDTKKMNRLRSFVSRFPFKTASEVNQELPGFSNISVRRIKEVLQKNLKMLSRTATKKLLLTTLMTSKRIKFCKKYLNWTPKQWENVMFSDEFTFRLVNSKGMKVRRPSRLNHYKQCFNIPTVKHSASVKMWGVLAMSMGEVDSISSPKTKP